MFFKQEKVSFIKLIRESFFCPPPEPLHPLYRFVYALSGSLLTAISFMTALNLSENKQIKDTLESLIHSDAMPLFIVIILALSIYFAWLVSWSPAKQGPLYLFVKGLVFPGFVLFILHNIFERIV